MDCRQAAEILSAAADGDLLDAADLALAREHCLSCPECQSLVRLMARTRAVPGPRAPERLLATLEGLASDAAIRMREAAETQEEEVPAELLASLAEQRPQRKWRWRPVATFASAAAVLLVALTMGRIIMLSRAPQTASNDGTSGVLSAGQEKGSAPTESGPAGDLAGTRAEMSAPSYVVFGDRVWILVGPASPSAVTTAGPVVSDLGTGTSGKHDAFLDSGGDELFVKTAEGSYLAFARVVRTLGRARYQMATDIPVEVFGQWPGLPSDIPAPTAEDGSPVFSLFGFDDRSVNVYSLRPHGIEDGFALAPGTGPDDPAAGNPNWTWWKKLD